MTNAEFRKLLTETFDDHVFMKDRDYHTVNELLHVLRYDEKLSGLQRVNISVLTLDDQCVCIPCLDAFVDIKTLGVWFEDIAVEFETDEFIDDSFEDCVGEVLRFDNITVYEREVK
jgi:hypothetical protein